MAGSGGTAPPDLLHTVKNRATLTKAEVEHVCFPYRPKRAYELLLLIFNLSNKAHKLLAYFAKPNLKSSNDF